MFNIDFLLPLYVQIYYFELCKIAIFEVKNGQVLAISYGST